MDHLDETTVALFLERRLAGDRERDLQHHIDSCDECRRLVAELGRTSTRIANGSTVGSPPSLARHTHERGDRIGRYRVLDLVGSGAMGAVYAAYDPDLDRKVAVKLLHSGAAASEAERTRLLREAQALARVTHAGVVAVHDVGTHGDHVFIAMEFVAGGTLKRWLHERARTWRAIRAVAIEAGRGLAAAHAVGLVHRDVKPDNILVDTRGVARIGDFGLAAGIGEPPKRPSDPVLAGTPSTFSADLTASGTIVGTPAYMAPEQFVGEPVTPLSDQFSFCVTLYEALYGVRPYPGADLHEIASAFAAGRIIEPAADRGVPRRVRDAVTRGLAIDPAERHASMDALVAALAFDPAVRRKRWLVVGVVTSAVVSAAVVLGSAADSTTLPPPCSGGVAQLEQSWNPGQRVKLEQALIASHFYPPVTVTSILQDVDGYVASWIATRDSACLATQRGEQSPALFDLQLACLDDRAVALASRIEVLTSDNKAIARAIELTSGLPRSSDCEALSDLLRLPPPPGDQETRRKLAEARASLARAAALQDAGRSADALEVLRPVGGVGYAPIEAQLALARGISRSDLGQPREADQLLGTAVALGLTAGTDEVLVEALIYRAAVRQLRFSDRERSDEYLSQAFALLDRHNRHPIPVSAEVYHLASQIYLARKDYASATTSIERGLAHQDRGDRARDRINRAVMMETRGAIRIEQGELEAGYRILLAAHDEVRRELGESHPTVARIAAKLGIACERLGLTAEANRYFAMAARGFTGSSSIDHQGVAALMYLLNDAANRDPARLREHALTLVALSAAQPEIDDTISILSMASAFLFEAGDLSSSRHTSQRAVALAAERTVDELQIALVVLAFCELADGELAPARRHVERAIAIERKLVSPDPILLGHALHLAGIERYRAKDFTAASRYLDEAARFAAMDDTEDTAELDKVLPFWTAATRHRAMLPGATRAAVLEAHGRLASDPDVSGLEKVLMDHARKELPP